jgi:hypothetical protein
VITPLQLVGRARTLAWSTVMVFAVVTIGFRHEVGGDWQGLLSVSNYLVGKGVHVGLNFESPSYGLLNWDSRSSDRHELPFQLSSYLPKVVPANPPLPHVENL